jgi:lysozyme
MANTTTNTTTTSPSQNPTSAASAQLNTNDKQNPLLKYRSYAIKNILVAFSTTSDAANTKIDYSVGKCGNQITGSGCGQPGIVIINEFVDDTFIIYAHDNEFTFHSGFDQSTTSMTGALTITDAVGGYFQDFLRSQAKKLNLSESHMIFALKTYVLGTTYSGNTEIIPIKPLIFHMYNLTHSYNTGDKTHNFYSLMYVADYNTFALLPNYSKLFQMTITHADSNVQGNTIDTSSYQITPTPPVTATITPTATSNITPTVTPITPTPTVTNGQPASSFTISQNGLNIIEQYEGLALTAYWDVNAWAIGYGHRKGVTQGMTITQQQAQQFLLQDLQWVYSALYSNVLVPITQGMFDALCSLTYNLGAAGYKTLLSTLNSSNYSGAQSDFSMYVYVSGQVNQGLVNRRAAEAALFGGQTPPTGNQPLPSQNVAATPAANSTNIPAKLAALNANRTQRLKSDKTMMTIGDVMDGFQAALKEQKTPPAPKLSQWLSKINQSYVNPLIPDDQEKSDGVLPIDYNIMLDPVYENYVINNRNIPFEQPDQSQTGNGIKVFQVKPGKMIIKTINNLMKLSNQVGDDAISTNTTQKSYKCNISCVKTCSNTYTFDVHIAQYIVPNNSPTVDTGPGENESYLNPLGFTYQKDAKDRDILNLSMSLFSDAYLGIMSQPKNSDDNLSVYGSREQIMLERTPQTGFFQSSYSGARGMANPVNFGLERPNGPVSVDNLVKTNLAQASKLYITIVGNPNLLSDIYRNPIKVVSEDPDSPNFYKYPEYYPMYAKLDIYVKPSDNLGLKVDKNTPTQYYYKGYYHLAKVKTLITGDLFTQTLEMLRTDDQT